MDVCAGSACKLSMPDAGLCTNQASLETVRHGEVQLRRWPALSGWVAINCREATRAAGYHEAFPRIGQTSMRSNRNGAPLFGCPCAFFVRALERLLTRMRNHSPHLSPPFPVHVPDFACVQRLSFRHKTSPTGRGRMNYVPHSVGWNSIMRVSSFMNYVLS